MRGALLCLLLVIAGCRTVEDMQRDYAKKITPRSVDAAPVADTTPARPARVMRVRVYADTDYQRQVLHWDDRLAGIFDRANRVLLPQFGVRLDVVDVRTWKHAPTDSLDSLLDLLHDTDGGKDVDWVVGLVSSVEKVATSHEELGRAFFFGKHFVLRGMVSLAETEAIHRTLDQLSDKEKDAVTRELRAHKEVAVLLHEWGHTLGAIHERVPGWLMGASYDPQSTTFSADSIRLVEISLPYHSIQDAKELRAWAEDYRRQLEKYPVDLADAESRARMLEGTQSLVEGGAPIAATAGPSSSDPLEQARAKEKAGDVAGAWALIEPLAREKPTDARLQSEACYLSALKAPRAEDTLKLCQAAVGLRGARPETLLVLAHVQIERKEQVAAYGTLARAEAAFPAAEVKAEAWTHLAQLYEATGVCSAAERVARRNATLSASKQAEQECRTLRRRLGPVSGLSPEREAAYVSGMRRAQNEIAASRLAEGRKLGQDLERDFPGTPGPAILGCLAESQASSLSRTKAACTKAALVAPETIDANYFLGLVALQEHRRDEAHDYLDRACQLDEVGEFWGRTASMYQRVGDSKALAALRDGYKARFGKDLRTASR